MGSVRLAKRGATWQAVAMASNPSNAAAAGGFLIAVGAIVGAFGGATMGEATAGFLIGTTGGGALAMLMWWRGRR